MDEKNNIGKANEYTVKKVEAYTTPAPQPAAAAGGDDNKAEDDAKGAEGAGAARDGS